MFRSTLLKVTVILLALLAGPQYAAAKDAESVTPAEIGAAQTAADHEKIAQSYDAQSSAAESKAEAHAKMAQVYRGGGGTPKSEPLAMAGHCDRLAQSYRAAAKEYRGMAAEHRKMAQGAAK